MRTVTQHPVLDPQTTAHRAKLVYVSDEGRGYTRHRAGKGFYYRNTRGTKITHPSSLRRIQALVIPPAWQEVWICPKALPKLRQAVSRAIRTGDPYDHDTVVATVVRLLDQSLIRVGNEQYADENKTHGLTTMRERDTDIEGKRLQFVFKAKGGIEREVSVTDPLADEVAVMVCLHQLASAA